MQDKTQLMKPDFTSLKKKTFISQIIPLAIKSIKNTPDFKVKAAVVQGQVAKNSQQMALGNPLEIR